MKINWKVRLQNKTFLVSLFAALLFLAQQVAAVFGVDITVYNEQVTNIFNALLVVLTLMGVVQDPTTPSVTDSDRAMTYGQEGKQ